MKLVFVTHCSAIKSAPAPKSLTAARLAAGPVEKVAYRWRRQVARIKTRIPAKDLYVGRGTSLIREAAEELGASWYAVSAGHGLVYAHTRIPSYDLSVSAGRSSVISKLRGRPDAHTWWAELTREDGPTPLKRLVQRRNDALIILALSVRYLKMVTPELRSLNNSALRRIRIVGPAATSVPAELRSCVMPYDARLNEHGSRFAGGHATFSQRAALHFLALVISHKRKSSLESHASAVRRTLRRLSAPKVVRRARVHDSRIKALIKQIASQGVETPNAALALVREQHGIACEQSRFHRLWKAFTR